ncbi:hypothetical protein ACH5RR_005774 [Cinchona calisaya]|uniref:Uncharacterized protein n=1 Tax=Cinchona calisaya TaxID=153742 RepID=A0ABD3AM45_9GENT
MIFSTTRITRNVLFVSNQNTENERTVIMRLAQEHGIPLTRVTFEAPSEMDVERERKSEAEQQQRDLEVRNALRDSWRDRKDSKVDLPRRAFVAPYYRIVAANGGRAQDPPA